jgi:predicted enzyme related to lactoylglutathione lyase
VLRRDEYPPGVPCWIDLAAPDPRAAARFYGELLGWELDDIAPPGATGCHLVARLHGATVAGIGPAADDDPASAAWSTYICVEDADAAAERVRPAGGALTVAPDEYLDAGRMAVCADPAGAAFRLWQPRSCAGAELVNAPGTWNWSDLTTPDPEGAVAFYGAVFGWQAGDAGYGDAMLWRLPGYGDFLARLDPSLRERHGEDGVPSGFSDAIGWMAPAAEGASTAQWNVTFSVADADAVAAGARRLGGRVVTEPFDAGPMARLTVIADPQGAVFTASQFKG